MVAVSPLFDQEPECLVNPKSDQVRLFNVAFILFKLNIILKSRPHIKRVTPNRFLISPLTLFRLKTGWSRGFKLSRSTQYKNASAWEILIILHKY